MYEKFQRPLSETERSMLRRQLDTVSRRVPISMTLRWFGLWSVILAVCLVLFVKGLSRPSGPSGIWLVILPVVVIVGILAFYFAYMVASGHLRALNYVRQFTRDQAPSIRAALESGCATVLKVSSNQCVVIEEFEDEGSAYIYDLGDGNSLYLQGQEYCPTPDDAPWPARQFEIVRAARDGRLVGIFCSHEPVEHVRTVLANEMPQDSWLTDEPKTESVLRGQPDEVLKTLRNRPQ